MRYMFVIQQKNLFVVSTDKDHCTFDLEINDGQKFKDILAGNTQNEFDMWANTATQKLEERAAKPVPEQKSQFGNLSHLAKSQFGQDKTISTVNNRNKVINKPNPFETNNPFKPETAMHKFQDNSSDDEEKPQKYGFDQQPQPQPLDREVQQ